MTLQLSPDVFVLTLTVVKILVIFGASLGAVPFMVLLERKLIARIQHRSGPNRVGPWGLLQTIVDGLKLFLKEDIRPTQADPFLHSIAPVFTVAPAIILLAILPIGPALTFNPANLSFVMPGLAVNFPDMPGFSTVLGIADLDMGVLYYMAITGVAIYGIVLAGYASNSKYALLGGIRSSAQMLSYELVIGLSLLGVLLIAGTIDLRLIVAGQGANLLSWNMITQPIGCLLFLAGGFAETNRLPFDLPEGESELGGGFHTEYSSMKFAMFFMAEYLNMFVFSAIFAALFLGGWNPPVHFLYLGATEGTIFYALIGLVWFTIKVVLMVSFMIFIRATWPRFRYDQLMDLGWKLMLPLALVNLVLTAGVIAFVGPGTGTGPGLPAAVIGWLFAAGIAQLLIVDRYLTIRKKRKLALT